MKLIKMLLVSSFSLFAMASYAEEEKDFYAGVKVGEWNYQSDVGDRQGAIAGFFGGYQINPYLSAEFDYAHASWAISKKGNFTEGSESDAVIFSLRPTLRLDENWELFAKIGWSYYAYSLATSSTDGFSLEESGSDNAYVGGLGLGWNKDNSHWRVEYNISDINGATDFQTFTIGYALRF